MKKQNREIFLTLAGVIDWNLCGFCRYSRSDGSACSEDSSIECESPIEVISERFHDGGGPESPSDDCWGFNPVVGVAAVADIVGTMLAEGLDPRKTQWYKYPDEKGKIYVEGLKS